MGLSKKQIKPSDKIYTVNSGTKVFGGNVMKQMITYGRLIQGGR